MEYVYWAVGIWCACGAAVWLWWNMSCGMHLVGKDEIKFLFLLLLVGPFSFAGVGSLKKTVREIRELREINKITRGEK